MFAKESVCFNDIFFYPLFLQGTEFTTALSPGSPLYMHNFVQPEMLREHYETLGGATMSFACMHLQSCQVILYVCYTFLPHILLFVDRL